MIRSKYPIKVIEKAIRILQLLSEQQKYISINEISKELDLFPSTIHRILNSLMTYGIVEKEENSKKYCLGNKLIELGRVRLNQINYLEVVKKYSRLLVKKFNKIVLLGIRKERKVLYLLKENSNNVLEIAPMVGISLPLHCTATGKVLLAYLPKKERDKVLRQKLKKFTEVTITSKSKLLKELEIIRKRNYAIDLGEHEKNICSIAAPIWNENSKVIAALSINIDCEIDNKLKNEMINAVIETTKKISIELGFVKN